ncbi:hypothetical protein DCC79_10275 [bacterium]|nr:MAG: hypothetical protein DCC79_10275 [bacterium]
MNCPLAGGPPGTATCATTRQQAGSARSWTVKPTPPHTNAWSAWIATSDRPAARPRAATRGAGQGSTTTATDSCPAGPVPGRSRAVAARVTTYAVAPASHTIRRTIPPTGGVRPTSAGAWSAPRRYATTWVPSPTKARSPLATTAATSPQPGPAGASSRGGAWRMAGR